jgi:helix-turn-helix protein
MTRRNRRPDRRRVKALRSYTIDEVARTLEVHRNTVRHWIKAGLPVIDDKRPILMLGADVAKFLLQRRDARRQPCRAGQMLDLRRVTPRKWTAETMRRWTIDAVGRKHLKLGHAAPEPR